MRSSIERSFKPSEGCTSRDRPMSSFSMTSLRMSLLAAAVLVTPLSVASAEETFNCDGATKTFKANTDGRILSVTSIKDRCIIVVLMHRDGNRPKRMAFDLPAQASNYQTANGKHPANPQILSVSE